MGSFIIDHVGMSWPVSSLHDMACVNGERILHIIRVENSCIFSSVLDADFIFEMYILVF